MIMHGTWYKGPQLVHHSHTEYHQFRSYPSFVVSPYHTHETAAAAAVAAAAASSSNPPTASLAPCAPCATPILVDNAAAAYAGVNQQLASGHTTQLTVLSPTIKIEQSFPEPLASGVDDYALNLECNGVEQIFKVSSFQKNKSDYFEKGWRNFPKSKFLGNNIKI